MANIDSQTSIDAVVSGPSPRQLRLLLDKAYEYGHILMVAFDDVVRGFDGLDRNGENVITRTVDGYEITFEFDASYDPDARRSFFSNEVLKVKNPHGVEFRIDPSLNNDVSISGNGFNVRLAEEGTWIEGFERGAEDERLACLPLLDKVADLLDKLKPQVSDPEQEGVREIRKGIVDLLKGF